jgi:putative spermidine/putrescine transport system substrate-binding protein
MSALPRSLLLGLALALAAPSAHAETTAHDPVMIASWGGAYQAAQQKILFDGFASRTGIAVEPVTLTGLKSLRDGLSAPGRKPTVADLPAGVAEEACAEGLAEPLDGRFLATSASGETPDHDFLLPAGPCGIPSTLMAEVVLYDKATFIANVPTRAADLFDLKAFPGKRAMKRDAEGTLEWALLADGVAPDLLYATLATPAGVERAFARLDQIRDSVLWWDHGDVPIKALAHKDVVMAAAYGVRAYQAIVADSQNFAIVWPGALVTANRWVLLKGAAQSDAAREFIKFATDRERLADLARVLPYGPARRSAVSDLPPEKLTYLASAPEHLADAVVIDAKFWQKNGEALRERFAAWLATPPKPAASHTPSPAPSPPAKSG